MTKVTRGAAQVTPAHRREERRLRARPATRRGRHRRARPVRRLARARPGLEEARSSHEGDEIVTAGLALRRSSPSLYPKGIPIGTRHVRRPERHRPLQADAGRAGRRLLVARRPCSCSSRSGRAGAAVRFADARQGRGARLLAALLQVTLFASLDVARRRADLVLVALVSIALLRGSVVGAVAGFFGGPPGRHAHARDARRHVAALHARRLLDRALRRDDRPRPGARAAPLRRSSSRSRSPSAATCSTSCSARGSGRRALFDTLLPTLVLNLAARRWPVFALCRRRSAGRPRPSARRRCGSLASSYPRARRRRAFLPPDPRAAEPYRFTPQLALRVGVLGGLALAVFAMLFLRLWALQVLSGDRYVNAAQNNQLRDDPGRGAARPDPRPHGPRDRRRTSPGTAVEIWTADLPKEGALRDVQRLSKILRVPLPAADAGARGEQGRPADADHRQDGRARGPGRDLLEHRAELPGRRDREHLPARLRAQGARRAAARLRRRDLARAS